MAIKIKTVNELLAELAHNSVHVFSSTVFELPYASVKKIIYPQPRYKKFSIKKRNGSERIIHEPRKKLKHLQDKLLAYLYTISGPAKPCVHGFTPHRSIVTNAKAHCLPRTRILLNIDIENFFPSITFYRVRGLFQSPPFSFSYSVATVLAQMCTHEGVLPQGAPTSPLIANLICRAFDSELMKLAKRHKATYTRYADDITFSFSVNHSHSLPSNICSFDSGSLILGEELKSIVQSHSFKLNPNKSRLSTRSNRLEVTGLTINEFPNVKRKFIDQIRGALHAWEVYGYALALKAWEERALDSSKEYEKRAWKRQRRIDGVPPLNNILWGKLLYLRMVRGRQDGIYSRLAERYNALCKKEESIGPFKYKVLPVDMVVKNKSAAEKAIFILEWSGDYIDPVTSKSHMVGAQGTAFAYKNIGLITCDHVLRFIDGEIKTDVQSADIKNLELYVKDAKSGKAWSVEIILRDKVLDLALIRFTTMGPSHNRFEAETQPLKTGHQGVLIGFPNHNTGKPADFLTTKVLNRYPRGGLQRLSLTDTIRSGNSGGPFVNHSYQLVGVAQQGAKQDSGNNECLPVEELDKWLIGVSATATSYSESETSANETAKALAS